ncbi:MAG: phosphatidylinositol-3-phosphatase [Acidimicrobiaceae bacterium]|jgi:hypothetical protein
MLGVLAALSAAVIVPAPSRAATSVPQLQHVFVVVLENQDYNTVMAPASPATYIKQLAADNTLLNQYYGVGHVSLTNYIGMTDGELPDTDTKSDCISKYCVRSQRNIADQLEDAGKTWKAYMGSMLVPCQHPPLAGAPDPYQSPYATRHNPYVYYTDIVDNPARCDAHDVPYEQTAFESMLASDTDVPSFNFVVPDNCDNSHDPICFEPPGAPESGGLKKADEWSASHLPAIINYVNSHAGSVLIVTFDEATPVDTSDCDTCGRTGSAGGHVVTIAIGQGVRTQFVDSTGYNHYSLLRTIEDGFGILEQPGKPKYLGQAAAPGIVSITAPFVP